MEIQFPDPEFEKNFQAYLNYVEDLAGVIGGRYGLQGSLVEGVHSGIRRHPKVQRIQRRSLGQEDRDHVTRLLRKGWGELRRMHRELDDVTWEYDEEANAWLPVQAFYAVQKAILGVVVASGQTLPRDHAATLRVGGEMVKRGRLPFPWSAYCVGCPQTETHQFGGLRPSGERVNALSAPDPGTTEDRLAMFLRTTRCRELDRKFSETREKGAAPGRSRRNLKTQDKERIAAKTGPTTMFDLFWRMRKKANYDDADTFVLGAAGGTHAERFGASLTIVTDATVAALEGLIAAYAGPEVLADAAEDYRQRARSDPGSVLDRRHRSWTQRLTTRSRTSRGHL